MARKKITNTPTYIPIDVNSAISDKKAESASYVGHLTRRRLLTADEEVSLALRIKQGDSEARTLLIEANMRLVISIARAYHSALVPFEDLVQEGAIGLMTACERFDPTRGFRFSTYATHWIRQAISRAIDNKSRAIRIPAHVSEILRKIDRVRLSIVRSTNEDPTPEQLAAALEMPVPRLLAFLHIGQDPLSLDMLVGEDENTSLASLVNDHSAANPEDSLIRREVKIELEKILDSLSDRERVVMRSRLGFDDNEAHVLQDIGHELNISRERVRQIELQALKRLKAIARRHRLWDYLTE